MWNRAAILALISCYSSAALAAPADERPIDAWDTFNKKTELQCPALRLTNKPASDVNYLQEGFYPTLNTKQSEAFNSAIPRVDEGPKACAKRNGVSCPTAWNMLALEKAGLLPRFVSYACSEGRRIPQ